MRNRVKLAAMIFAAVVALTCWAVSQDAQDHMNWLSRQLNLTDNQQAQLQPILQDEAQKMRAVYNDSSLSGEQKRSQFRQIYQSHQPQIQAILTPEQRQKLAAKKREYQQRMTEEPWP